MANTAQSVNQEFLNGTLSNPTVFGVNHPPLSASLHGNMEFGCPHSQLSPHDRIRPGSLLKNQLELRHEYLIISLLLMVLIKIINSLNPNPAFEEDRLVREGRCTVVV
jgi:hypothetical protein